MTKFFEILQFEFVQRALISGIFIAVCCAVLGVFLVLRRYSLIGDGLAHVSFAGVGLGLMLNIYPLYVVVTLAVLSSWWILHLSENSDIHGDAAIGLVSAVGVAGGVLLASIGKGFNVDLFSYLFGDILTVGQEETYAAVGLSLIVMIVVYLFYHELFALSYDEEYAHTLGIRNKRLNRVLLILTAITVVLGIRIVGTMLVSSLIVFPAVTALQVAESFGKVILSAALIALMSVVLGLCISIIADLPAGASVVLVNFAGFAIAFGIKRIVKG